LVLEQDTRDREFQKDDLLNKARLEIESRKSPSSRIEFPWTRQIWQKSFTGSANRERQVYGHCEPISQGAIGVRSRRLSCGRAKSGEYSASSGIHLFSETNMFGVPDIKIANDISARLREIVQYLRYSSKEKALVFTALLAGGGAFWLVALNQHYLQKPYPQEIGRRLARTLR
jgi:hypothetical protein